MKGGLFRVSVTQIFEREGEYFALLDLVMAACAQFEFSAQMKKLGLKTQQVEHLEISKTLEDRHRTLLTSREFCESAVPLWRQSIQPCAVEGCIKWVGGATKKLIKQAKEPPPSGSSSSLSGSTAARPGNDCDSVEGPGSLDISRLAIKLEYFSQFRAWGGLRR
jgi:hypothetical protein